MRQKIANYDYRRMKNPSFETLVERHSTFSFYVHLNLFKLLKKRVVHGKDSNFVLSEDLFVHNS